MLDHGTLDQDHNNQTDILRHKLRLSAAHIMADAVLQLFPQAKMGIGPPTQDGFYYDFDVPQPFTPDDLIQIEGLMSKTISQNQPFIRKELTRDEAKALFTDQPYNLEIIDAIPDAETLSIYSHGDFTDLCQGAHVENSSDIPAMKLLNKAGAYRRGDETSPI